MTAARQATGRRAVGGPRTLDVRTIPIGIIRVGERVRPPDPDRAAIIAGSFAENGQNTPITVNCPDQVQVPDFPDAVDLVIGANRIEAALSLGWTTISASLIAVSPDQARLIEIDENLARIDLSALDRCLSLAARKRVYERLHPRAKRGGDRRSDQTGKITVCGFATVAAEASGLSESAIYKAIATAEGLDQEIVARIRGTYLETHARDLAALAKLDAPAQRSAVEKIAGGKAKALSNALNGRPKPGYDGFSILVKAWERAGAKERRRFLDHIGAAS